MQSEKGNTDLCRGCNGNGNIIPCANEEEDGDFESIIRIRKGKRTILVIVICPQIRLRGFKLRRIGKMCIWLGCIMNEGGKGSFLDDGWWVNYLFCMLIILSEEHEDWGERQDESINLIWRRKLLRYKYLVRRENLLPMRKERKAFLPCFSSYWDLHAFDNFRLIYSQREGDKVYFVWVTDLHDNTLSTRSGGS